jgi:hypothetical protein
LSKAVVAANVLGSSSCLGHNGLLSLFAARTKPSATIAELRERKELPMNAKSLSDVILETKETCVFSEAKAAPAQEPEKVKAHWPADASVLQVAQLSLEVRSDGQVCINLSEERNGAAEGQDECPVCSEPAAAGAEPKEEEASEEVKITLRAEPSVQETAKQRRRRKRRERLRQNAVA